MFENSTALIIEDSPAVASFLYKILTQELKFASVIMSKNGEEGLIAFKQNPVDWVFSDVEMPLMSGLQVLAAVRELPNGKNVPFVLLTAHRDKETVSEALVMGASDFITKPFTAEKVAEKIRRLNSTPKAEADKASATRKRRVMLEQKCRISFSPKVGYTGDIVNMSLSGCLVRAPIFKEGGMIYDQARLSLADSKGEIFILKVALVRLEEDHDSPEDKQHLMAAFRFNDITKAEMDAIKALLMQAAYPVKATVTE